MTRFVHIEDIPEDTPEPLGSILRAIKQNLEVLAGHTGDMVDRAVKHGDVKVADAIQQSAAAAGNPPTQAEFDLVVADITELRTRYNYLAALLRGETVGS